MDTVAAGMLRLAAARDDVKTLDLLAHVPDFDVNASRDGFTPLLAAAVEGNAKAAAWLLRRGARVDALKSDGWGDTALHYAAAHGSYDTVVVSVGPGHPVCTCSQHSVHPPASSCSFKHGTCPVPVPCNWP
jgi:hypothetical protein